MSVVEPGGAAGLIERAKNLLISPPAEWDRIKGETTGLQALITGYVLPLAGLAAVCALVGTVVFGVPTPFGGVARASLTYALSSAVLQLVLACVGVWVLGMIVNAIAPSFGATQDQGAAYRLAAYFPTASWVAGVFMIFPALAIVTIIGSLYSLYLLWVGLPKLMNAPDDKKLGYFITVLIIAILVFFVIGILVASVQRMAMPVVAPF